MKRARSSHQIASRIAAGYTAVAALWILLSDRAVALLPSSFGTAMQSVKGIVFVLVTGAGLYVVIERVAQRFTREATSARAVERMLSHVVETVPVGIVLIGDDHTVTFLNKRAELLLGLSTEEAAGASLDEALERRISGAVAMVGEIMLSGKPGIVTMSDPTTEDRSVVVHAASLDTETKASGWILALAEISGRIHNALEIERAVSGYRLVAAVAQRCETSTEEIPLLRGVCDLAVESGRYSGAWAVWVGGRAGRVSDAGHAGLGSRTSEIARLMSEDNLPSLLGLDATAEGRPALVVSNDIGGDPSSLWYPAATEDGIGSAVTLCVSAGGGSYGILTLFAQDAGAFDAEEIELLGKVTDAVSFAFDRLRLDRSRFSAEQELYTSEQGYRALFENHPAPMWVYDLETLAFLAVNDAAVAKYGFAREQFVTMTIADIRPQSDIPALLQSVAGVTDGFEDAGIWAHRDASGREFPVHVYSHTIEWQGHHSELVMALEVARLDF